MRLLPWLRVQLKLFCAIRGDNEPNRASKIPQSGKALLLLTICVICALLSDSPTLAC